MTPDGGRALLDAPSPTLVWMMLGLVLLLVAAASAVRVVDPDQRAVVIRLGRPRRVRGPGLVWTVPGLERVRMSSVSPTCVAVPLRGSTREGVRVSLTVEALYQVVDPVVAVAVHPHHAARLSDDLERITHHEVAAVTLSQLLLGRELLAARLRVTAARRAVALGVRVLDVEITTAEVELNREVLRWLR